MAIRPVHPKLLTAAAEQLQITHHETGELFQWELNAEQRAFAEIQAKHPWVYVLKARQIGMSTLCALNDLLFCVLNEQRGNPVTLWLVWDKEENGADKLNLIDSFRRQLGIEGDKNELDLFFKGGSKIQVLTPGGKRVGASRTAHALHLSEMPNWPNPSGSWNSLKQSLIKSGRIWLETTMLTGNDLPKQLWDNASDENKLGDNAFRRVFFPVEMHEEYRADPSGNDWYRTKLAPHMRDYLKEEGFTREDTMTWMQWALHNNIAGLDRIALLREYPQTPRHCFNLAVGRWIRCEPEVLPHEGELVENQVLKIYKQAEDTSGYLIAGVDTAAGLGKDRNAIALIDWKTRELVASYVDDEASIEQMMLICSLIEERYTTEPRLWLFGRKKPLPQRPLFIIEKNTIGQATRQYAEKLNLNYEAEHTDDAVRYEALALTRAYVENGTIKGPYELSEEADSLHVVDGKFKGKKDLSIAIGLALRHIEREPIGSGDKPDDAEDRGVARFDGMKKLQEAGKKRWGRRF
jgi:hypothetical protein